MHLRSASPAQPAIPAVGFLNSAPAERTCSIRWTSAPSGRPLSSGRDPGSATLTVYDDCHITAISPPTTCSIRSCRSMAHSHGELYANIAQVGRPGSRGLAGLVRRCRRAGSIDGLWNCRRHPATWSRSTPRPRHGRRRARAAAVGPRAWPPQFRAPWRSIVRQTHPAC